MKKLLPIFLLLASINAIAGHRYVSSSVGNDSNSGLDSAHPYRSLTKVNAIYGSLAAGDTIFFKRSDTFLGQFAPMRSGLAGFNMVITSYGAGAKPIISGFILLHTWVNIGGNVWQCQPDSTLQANTNALTFNGIPQALGRTDWLHYSSATATQLTSSTTLSGSYVGAEVLIRKNVYLAEKAFVTAQSGNVLTFSNANEQPIQNGRNTAGQPGRAGYGFFLQRFAGSLDQQGEWFFDKTANKVKIYSTTNPNSATIKISFEDTLLLLGPRGYTVVDGLAFEGATRYAIESYGSTNVTIKNCDFNNNTTAIYMWNTTDAKAEYNNLENSFYSGIVISNNQSKRVDANYNYLHNTGQFFGMGVFNTDNSLCGILAKTDTAKIQSYVNIIGNKLINTGHMGISFQGHNVTVRRNIIDTCSTQIDDAGGIYTFINNQSTNAYYYTNRIIDSNFVSNVLGAPLGKTTAGGVDVVGLYFDDQTCNITVRYNTVFNIPGNGIQLNNPLNATVQYNTIYNCDYTVNENRKEFGAISGVLISNNILYQRDVDQRPFYTVTNSLTQPSSLTATQANQQLGIIDSNWVNDIYTGGNGHQSIIAGTVSNFSLATWKSTYGHETHSTLPPITVTSSNTRVVTNASDTVYQYGFIGFRKRSPKNVSYDNYISLPKWTSAVLIDNGTANIPPVANANGDQVLTLPTNNTAITGAGSSDADGSISSYAWVQISGPNAASLPTPNLISTGVNGLVQGIYKFKLTVTDNAGVSNSDTMQVTVNAAVNQVPHAQAGTNFSITLPPGSTTLDGSASTDADGTISTYAWTFISGPTTPIFGSANSATTTVGNLVQGVYRVRLTVTDNSGGTDTDDIDITVNAAANMTPIAVIAGGNQTITLPTNSTTLSATGSSDPDGSITAYNWTKISGPSGGTIATPNASSTAINSLGQGVYLFQLMVTDNYSPTAGTATTQVTITVNQAPNVLPSASAGPDVSFDPPRDTLTIFGIATDSDGSVASRLWRKILGPAVDIDDPTSATIIVSSLIPGTYQFEFTVTDDRGGTAKDTMQLVVNTQPFNIPPTASAGPDRTIYLPRDTVTLFGHGDDVDGPVTYYWSGSGGTIVDRTSATPLITGLGAGTYTFAVTVRDNQNAVTSASMTLTVVPEPTRQKRVLLGIKVKPQ